MAILPSSVVTMCGVEIEEAAFDDDLLVYRYSLAQRRFSEIHLFRPSFTCRVDGPPVIPKKENGPKPFRLFQS
jgi:hypothetical protein